MSMRTRLARWISGPAAEQDLRDEVEFHIGKRAESHAKAGLTPTEAFALAQKQFGDMEAVMNEMRRARLRSSQKAFISLAVASAMTAALWIYLSPRVNAPVVFPGISDVPRPMTFVKRPPPPPPPPTWEEFVKKVNTFGVGDSKRAGESGKSR